MVRKSKKVKCKSCNEWLDEVPYLEGCTFKIALLCSAPNCKTVGIQYRLKEIANV